MYAGERGVNHVFPHFEGMFFLPDKKAAVSKTLGKHQEDGQCITRGRWPSCPGIKRSIPKYKRLLIYAHVVVAILCWRNFDDQDCADGTPHRLR